MKRIEDIKVDLVNSKWLSFNKVNLEDPLFMALSKALKKDEVVYSIVNGNIILEDKKLAKESEKLAKIQEKQVKSGKPLDEETEKTMDVIANELADVKTPGQAIVVMTDARVITVYQDLNKNYKIKVLKKHVEDIQELNASEDADEQGLFNFSINFGKVTVNMVTENETNIKHFEFTLDQLIEIEAEKELNKESAKVETKIAKNERKQKPVVKKAANKPAKAKAKKAPAKKKPVAKKASKKSASKKSTKSTAKKSASKKPTKAKAKPVVKKPSTKKAPAKKAAKKPVVKKSKPVAKKTTAKKAAAKKSTAKKPVNKKASKKSASKKSTKPVAKKAAKKSSPKKSKSFSNSMKKWFKSFSTQAWKDIKSYDWIWLMLAALMGVGIIITSAIMYGTDWEAKYWVSAASCELAFAVIGFVFTLIYMLPSLKKNKFDYFKGFGLVLYVFVFIVSIIAITETGFDAINFISYIITVMGIWLTFDNLYTICDPLVAKLMSKKGKAVRK